MACIVNASVLGSPRIESKRLWCGSSQLRNETPPATADEASADFGLTGLVPATRLLSLQTRYKTGSPFGLSIRVAAWSFDHGA